MNTTLNLETGDSSDATFASRAICAGWMLLWRNIRLAGILVLMALAFSNVVAAPFAALRLNTIDQILAMAAPGQEVVYIDDMGFKVSYLQELRAEILKSGENLSSPTGTTKWTNNTVYYAFSGNVNATQQQQFIDACNEWEKFANVHFVARTNQSNYVLVNSSNVNNSFIGMQGGSQTINIFNWTFKYIICHEIAHALGMCHEQSRSDRDTYVTIVSANIDPNAINNFDKLSTNNVTTPYDFGSAMHYGSTAFSTNGQDTIVAKPGYEAQGAQMGQRTQLSIYDRQGMANFYGGPNVKFYNPGWTSEVIFSSTTGTNTHQTTFSTSDTIYVDVAPWNNGPVAIPSAWHVNIYVDGVSKFSQSYGAGLAANVYYSDFLDKSIGTLSAGSHTVRVVLDSLNELGESDETDNERSINITVNGGGQPNLTPYQPSGWDNQIVVSTATGAHTDSSTLLSSDTLYLDWAVVNNGTAAISGNFAVQLWVDGTLKTSWSNSPPTNANNYRSIDDYNLGSLSAGTHTLRIVADSGGVVSESNENDNEYTRTITVGSPGQPNLTPYQPSGWDDKIVVATGTGTHADSSSLLSSDTLYLDWAVTNNGTVAIGSNFTVQLWVDGVLKTSWSNGPPTNTGSYRFIDDYNLGSLSAGTHTLKIVADSGTAISESNESDNEYTRTITVNSPGQPNLTPSPGTNWSDKIVVSTTTGTNTDNTVLLPTDTLYVDWAVLNNGNANITANFNIQLWIDGTLKNTWSNSPPTNINVFRLVTDYNIGSLSAGTHTLRIVADSSGVISESNETDNEYTKTITVGQPNLTTYLPAGWSDRIVISNVTGTNTDTALLTTDTVYLDYAVLNNGSLATSGSFSLAIYIDGVLKTTLTHASSVSANGSYTNPDVNLGSLTAGSHTIRFQIDSGNTIAESNETDNEYTRSISVSAVQTGTIAFSASNYSVNENGASATITATRTGGSNGTVGISYATSNGSATANDDYTATTGTLSWANGETANKTFTVTINDDSDYEGDETVNLTLSNPTGGPALGTSSAVLTIVENDPPRYALTLQALPPAGGTVNASPLPQGDGRYAPNTPVTLTAAENTGYHITSWTGAATGSNSQIQVTMSGNKSVTANFDLNTYALTYLAGANGSISGNATQIVPYGASGSAVTAVPATGYHFVNWSDGSAANPRTDGSVTAALTVTANFDLNIYTLTYAAGSNGTLQGTSSQTVTHGGSGTAVTAVPDSGYVFVKWSDNSTANPRTDANVSGSVTVTANFGLPRKTLALSSDPFAGGSVSANPSPGIDGKYEIGTVVTLTPEANGDYAFTAWTGDAAGVDDPLQVTMDSDKSVTANFTRKASFAELAGTYHGLIQNSPGNPATHEGSGFLAIKVAKTGKFSASLTVGGVRKSVSGTFDADGNAGPYVVKARLPLYDVTLYLDLADPDGTITGELDFFGNTSAFLAKRAAFDRKKNPAPQAGRYTVLTRPISIFDGDPSFPQGRGAGTLNVTTAGAAKLTLTLPDGAKFMRSAGIAADGTWPCFGVLYKKRGYAGGWITFETLANQSDGDGLLDWQKPFLEKEKYFAQGFAGLCEILLSRYAAPKGLMVLPFDFGLDNAEFRVYAGDLPQFPADRLLTLDEKGKVANSLDDKFKMTITLGSGLFSGQFPDPQGGPMRKFHGVLFQQQTFGGGWYEGNSETGGVRFDAAR